MRVLKIPVLLAVLGLAPAGAQQMLRKEPFQYTGPERASRVEARPPGMRLGLRKPREFALAPLSESEKSRLAEPSTRLKKTGIQRALAPHLFATGTWETTSEGTRVWRLAIRSPQARGIRVEFVNFSVGSGKVWLHDGTNVAGPYTGTGLYDDGHFFSASVFSDSIIVEYEPAPEAGVELEPPFEIRSVVHRVRSPLEIGYQENPADYCELDPNCYPDWKPAMSSVGQITFMIDGNEVLCSGSLMATRDNSLKPYFLTAGHCINTEAAARTVQAYWTYQTSACGATPPTSRDASTKSTLGAHLVSFLPPAAGDYSLILLPDVPSGVTFSGWDTTDPPISTDLTGIHHPSGSWKRISFGERTSDSAADVEGTIVPAGLFLQVQWNEGRVEPGSSGSPLFSAPGVVVGSLSYGPVLSDGTVCTISPSVAGYSRFSNTYSQIQNYLENYPSNLVIPAKTALTFTVANHATPAGQTVQLTTQSTGQEIYKLRADANWITLSNMTGSLTGKAPASVTISVDPKQLAQAGQYNSTVTVLSGAAPPQYINIVATVKVDQSNVAASITPNPVVQTGGQFSFQIRLTETAGVATHLTAMKFNGQDYTQSMATWFGGTRIAANGSLLAPMTGTGAFPAGDQYFEFWGVDDASGTPWYRTAVVTFR